MMFRPLILLPVLALVSCVPYSDTLGTGATDPVHHPQTAPAVYPPHLKQRTQVPTPTLPPQNKLPLAYHHTSRNGVVLSMVSFDDRDHQLRVADQPNGLGSRWLDARSAAATYRGLAAINGGFFTPQGKPLGLLIETGTKRGYVNQSSLGAGIFASSKTGSSILRRERYSSSSIAAHAYNLLQTGPMLAEAGKPISGLSKTNNSPRSFIAWDGRHHWAIGYSEPCTLDELSRALAGKSPTGFYIHTAVNLDGGRSSDLWAGPLVKNGNKTHRTFFNKPVRNYLVLITR